MESNKKDLIKRYYIKNTGRKWYEIWVPQNPSDFNKLKIVTSDLSLNNTFSLERNGFFCLDSCYYIILKEESEEYYKFILGLLNSKLIEFFHKIVCSTHVYSNRYRYMTSYMKNYPINFKPQSPIGKKIIKIVDKILKSVEKEKSKKNILELENELNKAVFNLYQLNKNEENIIENALTI